VKVLTMPSRSRFVACAQCGEEGTWGPEGVCWSCQSDASQQSQSQWDRERLSELKENREETLLAAGVPRRYARCKFHEPDDGWPTDPRMPEVDLSEWQGRPCSAVLSGPVGNGKTSLAVERLFRGMCDGAHGRFVRAGSIPRIYFGDSARESAELETCELLVVDDLGRGHLGKAWHALGEVLAARHADERATIITTNLTLVEISDFDPHMADRLTDGLVMGVQGESLRGLKAS
jgi:hypothetical protein